MVNTNSQIHAVVPIELRQGLAELAHRNYRTLSAELRRAIAAHLQAQGAEHGSQEATQASARG